MWERVVAVDLEATGLDPLEDRIVELAIVRAEDGLVLLHQHFHPGISIPPPATAVHGISNADVAHCDGFAVHASRVQAMLQDAVLMGYNSRTYDTVMIDAELRRAGERGLDLAGMTEIDLFRVWTRSEKRTLELAVQRFLGHDHAGAHSALSDAEALLPLARAMQRAWALEDFDLMDRSRPPGEVDRSRRLRRAPGGEVVFNFGTHAGTPVREHEDYAEWMLQSDFPRDTLDAIRHLKENGWRWP
ncbi:MAG: 3'-5' exonuclease [Gemmatimonadetes bacterium]|nr:3'-5' exonuclease [Gemmatimonadota bacterium]NNK47467.1 3'-5' exonuclease [Gemmatimonadota bacterium]